MKFEEKLLKKIDSNRSIKRRKITVEVKTSPKRTVEKSIENNINRCSVYQKPLKNTIIKVEEEKPSFYNQASMRSTATKLSSDPRSRVRSRSYIRNKRNLELVEGNKHNLKLDLTRISRSPKRNFGDFFGSEEPVDEICTSVFNNTSIKVEKYVFRPDKPEENLNTLTGISPSEIFTSIHVAETIFRNNQKEKNMSTNYHYL